MKSKKNIENTKGTCYNKKRQWLSIGPANESINEMGTNLHQSQEENG